MRRVVGEEERLVVLQPDIQRVESLGSTGAYDTLVLHTARGPIETRIYQAPRSVGAALLVGGVGGDFDSPARDLYPRLCEALVYQGLSALRVCFRHSTDLDEAVHDVLAGVALLHAQEIFRTALVGHSFGGAVVIRAGSAAPEVIAVVCLATQAHGTEAVSQLARPLLLVHGTGDEVLPPEASVRVYERARAPKELRLFEAAGHTLDEVADDVYTEVEAWLIDNLVPTSG